MQTNPIVAPLIVIGGQVAHVITLTYSLATFKAAEQMKWTDRAEPEIYPGSPQRFRERQGLAITAPEVVGPAHGLLSGSPTSPTPGSQIKQLFIEKITPQKYVERLELLNTLIPPIQQLFTRLQVLNIFGALVNLGVILFFVFRRQIHMDLSYTTQFAFIPLTIMVLLLLSSMMLARSLQRFAEACADLVAVFSAEDAHLGIFWGFRRGGEPYASLQRGQGSSGLCGNRRGNGKAFSIDVVMVMGERGGGGAGQGPGPLPVRGMSASEGLPAYTPETGKGEGREVDGGGERSSPGAASSTDPPPYAYPPQQ
ncbi:hypothetical protein BJ742DRAFT_765887 [Cladochytrium replicatum]|nr:hypothetical protein BJ742DRAFT_765887 [Cladochytrium replicatum]